MREISSDLPTPRTSANHNIDVEINQTVTFVCDDVNTIHLCHLPTDMLNKVVGVLLKLTSITYTN